MLNDVIRSGVYNAVVRKSKVKKGQSTAVIKLKLEVLRTVLVVYPDSISLLLSSKGVSGEKGKKTVPIRKGHGFGISIELHVRKFVHGFRRFLFGKLVSIASSL